MDVPFISSGALSRAHYSLVRKVESEASPQVVDQHLQAEVKSTRHRLAHPDLSLKQCKECLIILLYCSTSMISGYLSRDVLETAFPHAVGLAEAGQTIKDKRIGYLFCAEMMPLDHELQLMLVNTLRKDLERPEIPHICLALDNLIASSTADVIPAVYSRLTDLLSHNSPQIRRRALLALTALSRHDAEILTRLGNTIIKRLNDPEPSVVSAALSASVQLAKDSQHRIHTRVNDLLLDSWSHGLQHSSYWILLRILQTLRAMQLSQDSVPVILNIIRSVSKSRHGHTNALLLSAFLSLSGVALEKLIPAKSSHSTPISHIRHLLTSREINDQYFFLSCVESLDPGSWAGTVSDIPLALDEWEVERIMQLLGSPDALIRKKTLRILYRIDQDIVKSCYSQSCQSAPSVSSLKNAEGYAERLLEIAEVHAGEDGEAYASLAKEVLPLAEIASGKTSTVLERAVEMILIRVESTVDVFRIGCVTSLIISATEISVPVGPSLMVVVAALACKYCTKLSVSPAAMLHGFSARLASYPPNVQDACLLSMMRIAAECDTVPPEAITAVNELSQRARRHIQRRCDQFLALSRNTTVLADIVRGAKSDSIPDFLQAIQEHEAKASQQDDQVRNRSPETLSPRQGTSKLRYAAYEPPSPMAKLRRPLSPPRSTTGSELGYELNRGGSVFSDAGSSVDDRTAGQLTLAAGEDNLDTIAKDSKPEPRLVEPLIQDVASRVDLIAFDSPFVSDPSASVSSDSEPDFEDIWDTLENSSSRGWSDAPVEGIVRRLQGLVHQRLKVIAADEPPFEGDLKILVSSDVISGVYAVLRIRESDDKSSLWRLRCADAGLRTQIKRALSDE